MQMDTGEVQSIAGVATQGRRDAAQWVTSIIVQATLIELNYQHLKQN